MGFDSQQQRKPSEYHKKALPVQLANCEMKSSQQGDGYEVRLKSGTQIKESPKKMDVSALIVENATSYRKQ